MILLRGPMRRGAALRGAAVALMAGTSVVLSATPALAVVENYASNKSVAAHSYVYTASKRAIYSNYAEGTRGGSPAHISVFYINSSNNRVGIVYGYPSAGNYNTSPSPAKAACSNEENAASTLNCEWNHSA